MATTNSGNGNGRAPINGAKSPVPQSMRATDRAFLQSLSKQPAVFRDAMRGVSKNRLSDLNYKSPRPPKPVLKNPQQVGKIKKSMKG